MTRVRNKRGGTIALEGLAEEHRGNQSWRVTQEDSLKTSLGVHVFQMLIDDIKRAHELGEDLENVVGYDEYWRRFRKENPHMFDKDHRPKDYRTPYVRKKRKGTK